MMTIESDRWSKTWRLTIIGLAVLILSSCRAPETKYDTTAVRDCAHGSPAPQPYPGLPPEAYSGVPAMPVPPMGPPGMEQGVPLPYCPSGPWQPPGIAPPWPQDEYVCDGNDAGLPTQMGNQYEIRGLEMEDAVAHFDTLDGRTVVEPSNRVCVYAPRFAAVRQVTGARVNQQEEQLVGASMPVRVAAPREVTPVASAKQNFQARGEISSRPAEALRTRWSDGVLSNRLKALAFVNDYKAYENATAIRTGVMIESEAAFLARGSEAAIAWNKIQAVQILLDRMGAMVETGGNKPELVYTANAAPGCPRLRLIKVASTPFAEPGDTVSFTLRFDNVGNQIINNVTILDSLSTRLEYLPDTAQCSREAQFSERANEGDSVVLRCELTEPLPPGKGGVLRFQCRVR